MSFSKDPAAMLQEALQKNYARVRFQQGKPVLDRELNLLGDLAGTNRLAEQYIGNGLPPGSKGFAVSNLSVPNNDFAIKAGRCLVGGYEVVLAADTTYKNQPVKAQVAALPGGASNVYLRVFLSPVTEADDASLANVGAGDIGFVTSVRERANWEVLVSVAAINATDHFLLATINTALNSVTDMRRAELSVAALKDEIKAARGSAPALGTRLDAAHAPDGSLKPNTVANAQLTANAVTFDKLADASITAVKIAPNAVSESSIVTGAVSKRTIASGAVSIAGLGSTVVFDAQLSVPASPGAGQVAELVVTIDTTDGQAFHLVSVQYVGPRPNLPPAAILSSSLTWVRRTQLFKASGTNLYVHRHQVVLQNPQTAAITVACKAYRIAET
ncbi:MAG: hypothetical protein WCD76_08800 [Pyrinomonadaceae bacterium]